jgi:hypothetical protein
VSWSVRSRAFARDRTIRSSVRSSTNAAPANRRNATQDHLPRTSSLWCANDEQSSRSRRVCTEALGGTPLKLICLVVIASSLLDRTCLALARRGSEDRDGSLVVRGECVRVPGHWPAPRPAGVGGGGGVGVSRASRPAGSSRLARDTREACSIRSGDVGSLGQRIDNCTPNVPEPAAIPSPGGATTHARARASAEFGPVSPGL